MNRERVEGVASLSGSPRKILIVEDDSVLANQWRRFLREHFDVKTASCREEALKVLTQGGVKACLLDLGLPPYPESPEEGLRLLREALEQDHLLKVIVITAYGQREVAEEALQLGAYDLLSKPVDEELLLTLLRRALWRREMEEGWLSLREEDLPVPMVVASEAMRRVIEEVRKLAPLPMNCLITGESGTGKELVAQLLHHWSKRRDMPFVAVDCAAIPATLGEAELFGAEKGAYTGAVKKMPGKVAQAEGGSLFLDEIGELSWELQAKLLRFLETKEYAPLGGRAKRGDVRVIAATNRDLEEEVTRGKFRLDLFHRLNEVVISLPPLRERREEIIPLALYFIRRLSREFDIPSATLSPDAQEALLSYPFPGNVRELRNILTKALLLKGGETITAKDIPLGEEKGKGGTPLGDLKPGYDLPGARKALEERWVKEALRRHGGKVTPAARDLEIPRTTLYDLMKKYPGEFKRAK